jgi:hypothetical protein
MRLMPRVTTDLIIDKYYQLLETSVIEEHNKWVEFYRRKNAIVEPPDMNNREANEFFE